jgi:iron complex transport system substrate-binding protein
MNLLKFKVTAFIITAILFFALINTASAAAKSKKFTDETKREVTVKNFPPKRIVSLSPSVTEILFALGLNEEIIGVTKECDYPPAAKEKKKVGEYTNFNMELLVSLNPDIVIISAEGNLKGELLEMERLNLIVYAVRTRNISELLTTIKDIGAVTGREKEGEKLSKTVEDEIEAIKVKIKDSKKKTVFCAVGMEPVIGVGPKTLIGDIIKICGGINIIDENGPAYPIINIEELYVKDPDVILVSSMGSEVVSGTNSPLLKKFSKMGAAKRGAMFTIDADVLCRPSYRIVDAIRDIAQKIHPEKL